MRLLKYNEVKIKLIQLVQQRKILIGGKLPSERELSHELGISIISVRRALQDFANAGMINKVHGVGNFLTGPLSFNKTNCKIALVNIGDVFYPNRHVMLQAEEILKKYHAKLNVFYAPKNIDAEILHNLQDFDKILVTGFINQSWVECLSSLGKPLLQVGICEEHNNLTKVYLNLYDSIKLAIEKNPEIDSKRIGFLLPDHLTSTYGMTMHKMVMEYFNSVKKECNQKLICHVPRDHPIRELKDFLETTINSLDVLIIELGCLTPFICAKVFSQPAKDVKVVMLGDYQQSLPEDFFTECSYDQIGFETEPLLRAIKCLFEKPISFFNGNKNELIHAKDMCLDAHHRHRARSNARND